MKKIIITGGAGFIGSHICEQFFNKYSDATIHIIDKLTYAGNLKYLSNILKSERVKFHKLDILNYKLYRKFIKNSDLAINVAAESHVDNSFNAPVVFSYTNTVGAHIFLLECINQNVKKIIHISSDEVYGEILKGSCSENRKIEPTNPYSASKAAAEIFISSYRYSYKKEIITVRANNIYGIRQFPEKLIPKCIISLLQGKKIPIHGNGKNERYYLSALDFAEAVYILSKQVKTGVFNVGSRNYYSNNQIANLICNLMGKNKNKNIKYVKDRPYNDKRYSVSSNKIKKLGWKQKSSLEDDLPNIIDWYKNNYKLFKNIKW